jgi:hypothetical protein
MKARFVCLAVSLCLVGLFGGAFKTKTANVKPSAAGSGISWSDGH